MVTMEHPNGCVHNVREEHVARFEAAGWKVKAAPCEPPVSPAEPKKKRKTTKK